MKKFRRVRLKKKRRRLSPASVDLGPHSGNLRLIAFSDYRVQDIQLLAEEIAKLSPPPDVILYGGDDICRFRPSEDENLFERLAACSRYGLFGVIGNDDEPGVARLVSGKMVFNVHRAPIILGDYAILGVEGAPTPPGFVVHSEKEIAKHLALQKKSVGQRKLIIVSHAPPAGTLDKALRFSPNRKPRSIGSRALRKFVDANRRVALIICGHVHRCGGGHEKLNRAVVINAACHDHFGEIGRFAITDLEFSGRAKVEWREILEVSCVAGVGPSTVERLRQIGVRTVDELAKLSLASLARVGSLGRSPEILQARARAHSEARPILLRPLQLPPGPEIFLDIETDPDGGKKYVWLIGFCVGRDGPYKSYFAATPDDEKRILTDFIHSIQAYPNANVLTFSGSRFEERIFRERLSTHQLDMSLCSRIVDLSPILWRSIALPIGSEELKEAAKYFGYSFKHAELSGFEIAMCYQNEYCQLRNATKREKLEQRFLEYNEDDVRCLPSILEAIDKLQLTVDTAPTASLRDEGAD